jgi:hypothetical protein
MSMPGSYSWVWQFGLLVYSLMRCAWLRTLHHAVPVAHCCHNLLVGMEQTHRDDVKGLMIYLMCFPICVCVRARARVCVCVCACVHVRMRVHKSVSRA